MRRWFNVLAALSLLLCMATAALWVRSCRWIDRLDFDITWNVSPKLRGSQVSLDSGAGHVGFSLSYDCIYPLSGYTPVPRASKPLHVTHIRWPLPQYAWAGRYPTRNWCGFYTASTETCVAPIMDLNNPISITNSYGVPDWSIILLTALAPAILLRRKLRRKPLPGHCLVCGYDLRATPDRCPECGTIPQKVDSISN